MLGLTLDYIKILSLLMSVKHGHVAILLFFPIGVLATTVASYIMKI
jgi:hypothetical protein